MTKLAVADMIEIDNDVREALGVGPCETIEEAAKRILASNEFSRRRIIASTILRGDLDPWDRMKRAAHAAKRLA